MKIKYSWDICSECNLPKLITQKSKHLCTSCNQKRLTKGYRERLKQRIKDGKITDKQRLARFFKKYWEKHKDRRCFETGCLLYTYHSYHFHHLIEKHKHPELAFKEDNIVYLSLEVHSAWHGFTDKERKVKLTKLYKKTKEIKNKYNVE